MPQPIPNWVTVRMGEYRWFSHAPTHSEIKFPLNGSLIILVSGEYTRMGNLILTGEELEWIANMRLWLLTQPDSTATDSAASHD